MATLSTQLRAGKVINRKELKIVAHFVNGFAQTVYELEDGTVLFFNYSGDTLEVEQRELLTDPFTQIPAIVNASEEE